MSVGKSSAIVEMLTIRFAASEPPGERARKVSRSSVTFVHFGGMVHDSPCWSHLMVCPPASAAVWAAVGTAFSAVIPPFEADVPVPVGPLAFFDFVRLHSERARPSNRSVEISFICRLATGAERAECFYARTRPNVNVLNPGCSGCSCAEQIFH